MQGVTFNIDGGYLEGLCRGFKNGILKQTDYLNLVQCETLEGKKEATPFSHFIFQSEFKINLGNYLVNYSFLLPLLIEGHYRGSVCQFESD